MTTNQLLTISEPDLLGECRKGNEAAFRKLVAMHKKQVRRTAIGMLGETAEAEDVAQETFIRFFKSLNSFREDAKTGTFLTRIAINLSLNELKRRKRKNRWLTFIKKDGLEISVEDISANPDKMETKELVQKALKILAPEFRAVVVLRMLDGYSVKEAAEILQLPEGTVASRLARGQKKLKNILEKIL
ncbi:MAG TPA: RNA polymerase sigma factor [Bacteroidetes bacterium]|nr:RNA polymerase sigma factor [Bacteroidota bacterium]